MARRNTARDHPPAPGPAAPAAAPPVPIQPGIVPVVTSVVLPDGRVVTGYTLTPTTPAPSVPATFAVQPRPPGGHLGDTR